MFREELDKAGREVVVVNRVRESVHQAIACDPAASGTGNLMFSVKQEYSFRCSKRCCCRVVEADGRSCNGLSGQAVELGDQTVASD